MNTEQIEKLFFKQIKKLTMKTIEEQKNIYWAGFEVEK